MSEPSVPPNVGRHRVLHLAQQIQNEDGGFKVGPFVDWVALHFRSLELLDFAPEPSPTCFECSEHHLKRNLMLLGISGK